MPGKKNSTLLIKWLLAMAMSTVSAAGAYAQFPVALDVVYDFIKTNSIHRYQVNWNKEDQQFWAAISTAHNLQDTMNAFVHVLKDLDDEYSQLHYNDENYGYERTANDYRDERIQHQVEMAKMATNKIQCELLGNQYAYIRIPGFDAYGSAVVGEYSKALRDTIEFWNQQRVKGFILDLRLNRGGNIYPMLNGLGRVLGDGLIAQEVDVSYLPGGKWNIHNGVLMINNYSPTNDEEPEINALSEIPVVVLTGPATASSGSITAIAFKGRKNSISIGEPTAAGYTVSNGFFQFAPNLFLNLAVSYIADRNMRFYPSAVEPDIVVKEGDDFENVMRDQKIKRAILWLNGH